VPLQLNVKILRGKTYKHLRTIKSSKGVGEPPFLMGVSVFFALREAVKAARAQNGLAGPLIGLKSPCTAETLRLACGDELVQKATVLPTNESEKPWSVRLI
jgi:xanthine dehydrogenase/oxidase